MAGQCHTGCVSGVDTVRGINFQHCHAVLVALEVVTDEKLAGIRVEGIDDVLDLEVHAPTPDRSRTVVVRGLQMKSRMRPYTWAQSELLKIVQRWAGRPLATTSEFALLTDGELGPSGREVAAALESARSGDTNPIAAILGVQATDPLCALAARVEIVSAPGTVEGLLLAAEREVRARLPAGPHHPDAMRDAQVYVNELFVLISKRAGLQNPDARFISRDELLSVLGGISQLSAADRWTDGLGPEYEYAVASADLSSIVVPSLIGSWTRSSLTVDELDEIASPILLTGRTGSGKSTLARIWRAHAASVGRGLVICHAEAYLPQAIDRAVADAVGAVVGRALPRAVGRQVLADPGTTIVFDGVSEVPSHVRAELAKELRTQLAGGHGARVAVLGRDETVCANVFPSTQAPARLYPQAFGQGERLRFTAMVRAQSRAAEGVERGAATDVYGGSAGADDVSSGAFDQECRVALAQVEHALGDAAGNPMLLRMALELVDGGIEFSDRASVYALTVDRMAARANVVDIRIASAALGIVFGRLLDEGRRFANPLEWARLFDEAGAALEKAGVVSARSDVRDAVERSGLVNEVVTGIGQTQIRVPVHDSFADYFAARAHADGFIALPEMLDESDESRILMSAQMKMLSDSETMSVAAQLPFSLVRLSESDHRDLDDATPAIVAAILSYVLPDQKVGVTMWWDGHRPLAQIGGGTTSWVESPDAPELFDGAAVVGETAEGPVAIAVRLWRLILNERLRRKPQLRPRSPQSCEEGRDQLARHSEATISAGKRLLEEVAPPAAAVRLAQVTGPLGLSGIVYDRQEGQMRGDGWPVRYTRTSVTEVVAAPDAVAGDPWDAYTSASHLQSLVSKSPEQTSADLIGDAICRLTRSHWL